MSGYCLGSRISNYWSTLRPVGEPSAEHFSTVRSVHSLGGQNGGCMGRPTQPSGWQRRCLLQPTWLFSMEQARPSSQNQREDFLSLSSERVHEAQSHGRILLSPRCPQCQATQPYFLPCFTHAYSTCLTGSNSKCTVLTYAYLMRKQLFLSMCWSIIMESLP